MSHTMNIAIEMKDMQSLASACERLGLKMKQESDIKLFGGTYKGISIKLPGWNYPICVQHDGIKYDNYNGAWGDMSELEKLKSYYGIEKAKIEARKKGYSVYETMENNELTLKITMEG